MEDKVKCGKGLMTNLEDHYNKLNVESLEDTFKKLFLSPKEDPQIVIYTGMLGMQLFDLQMMLSLDGVKGTLGNYKYWIHTFEKAKGFVYISIIRKEGLYKIKYMMGKKFPIHLYKGTTLISQSNNFNDINKRIANLVK